MQFQKSTSVFLAFGAIILSGSQVLADPTADSSSCQSARASLASRYQALNGEKQYTDWAKAHPKLAQQSAVATKIMNELWSRLTPSALAVVKQYSDSDGQNKSNPVSTQTLSDALSPAINSLNSEANFMKCGPGDYRLPDYWGFTGQAYGQCYAKKTVLDHLTGADPKMSSAQELRSLTLEGFGTDNPTQKMYIDLQLDDSGRNVVHVSVPVTALDNPVPFTRLDILSRNHLNAGASFCLQGCGGAAVQDQPEAVTYATGSTAATVGAKTYPLTRDEYVFAHLPAQCQMAERGSIQPLDVSSPLAIVDQLNGAPSLPPSANLASGNQHPALAPAVGQTSATSGAHAPAPAAR